MSSRLILFGSIAACFAGSFLAAWAVSRHDEPPADPRDCRRIVALAPSVTETLFALGLGDRVVGVSRYCDYPPEAKKRPQVGGHFDPNFEAVVALEPDLVVMLIEHKANRLAFEKLGIATLMLNHQTIDGVLASLPALGRACGAETQADELATGLRRRMERVARKVAGAGRPRVLFVVDRGNAEGTIQDCYVAGREGYLDTMIELAGGSNACRDKVVRYPVVSREGIMWLNPEVIIDMSSGITAGDRRDDPLVDWRSLETVPAVRDQRCFALSAAYAFRPSPRFIELVERLARMIHPEVDWEQQ